MNYTRNHCLGADLPAGAFQRRGGRHLATLEGGGSGGGGGSSNPDTRYANLDQLYGVQTQASRFMLDNAMPHVPTVTENSRQMVSDAMDGTLATQLREQAGRDATGTMGAALEASNRNMQRYGMGFSANRLLAESNRNAIMGAAQKTGAMNKADQWAEDQKWNRNAGFFGQVTGMNNGAMQGLSSAGAGMTNIANQQNANDQKNAAGFGQAGAAFAGALTKADGGYIDVKCVRLADGGNAWEAYKAAHPVASSTGGGRRKGSNPGLQMLSGAAPQLLGYGVKDVFNLDGKGGKIVKAGKGAVDYIKQWQEGLQAAQQAQEYAEAADVINAGMEAGSLAETGVAVADLGALGATYDASGAIVAADTAATASDAAMAADTAQTASEAATAADIASSGLKDGGAVGKAGQHLALGGLANAAVAKSNTTDGTASVANMDASANMAVANMGGAKKNEVTKPTHAVQDNRYRQFDGKTDGMGESSTGDPDGFGVYNADSRHAAGSGTIKFVGNALFPGLGTLLGDTVADAIHPIMEPLTRKAISDGDKYGGVSGAVMMDPAGAAFSGKYKPEELVKGSVEVGLGMPWAGKFLADGGESDIAREDFKPGGPVEGPGTDTSDDIPAWLSNGEHVQNAVSTEIAGVPALDAINEAGRRVRYGESTRHEAQRAIGEAMLKRGRELLATTGPGLKRGVKLAGGGWLGGNLGIALGAGVEEMHRQNEDARRDQILANQNQQLEWARLDQAEKQRVRDEQAALRTRMQDIGKRQTAASSPETFMVQTAEEAKAAAALNDMPYEPRTAEQDAVIRQHYAPDTSAFDRERVAAFNEAGDFASATAMTDRLHQKQVQDNLARAVQRGDKTREVVGQYAAVDPKTALPLLVKDDSAEAMERLRLAQIQNTALQAEENRKTREAIAQANLDWKAQNAKSGTAGKSGAGALGPAGAVYGQFGYKNPSEFTDDIRKRVAADGANAGMGNVDVQTLATKTQQYAAGLMTGHAGGDHTIDELFPVAYQMAKVEMGVKPLGPDGKPVTAQDESGAYKPYATLGADLKWYPRVRDAQGAEYTLSGRGVTDPAKFGISPERQAAAELGAPGMRELMANVAKDMAAGDRSSFDQAARVLGAQRVEAMLQSARQPAAAAAPAATPGGARAPVLKPAGGLKPSRSFLDRVLDVQEVPVEDGIVERRAAAGRSLGYGFRGLNYDTLEAARRAKQDITAPAGIGRFD